MAESLVLGRVVHNFATSRWGGPRLLVENNGKRNLLGLSKGWRRMEGQDRAAVRRDDRWRSARLPVAATGLVLVERVLTDEVGSPVALLRDLGDLGRSPADPIASVLAVIALMAEALIAYVLVVLLLRSLCLLPGIIGRLAGRLMSLVTPAVVQRLLDLLVGGALLAQVTLATGPGAPPGHRWSGSDLASTTASLAASGSVGPAALSGRTTTSHGGERLRWPVEAMEPAGARPTPRRSAAPLPPWLGGGPSKAVPAHGGEAGQATAPRQGNEAGNSAAPRDGEAPGDPMAPRHGDTAGDRAPRQKGKAGGSGAPGHVVEVGDTLWDIAAARLAPAQRSAVNVHRYWRLIYRANRSAIGPDPDLILPGTRLDVPPFRRAGR
jgi:nucleoid-associated protein YgaU